MSVGDTAPLITIAHDWSSPVEMERSYPSRVIVREDGSEQRLSLSGTPTDVLTYRLLALSAFDATQLQALPMLATDSIVRMPRWEDQTRITSAVSSGLAVSIPCDTTYKPTLVTNVHILLWRDATTWEVTIASIVTSSTITADLASSWGAGTIVAPITPVRLTMPVELTNWAPTSGALTLQVTTSLSDIAGVGTGGAATTATPAAIVVSDVTVPPFGKAAISALVTDSAGDSLTSDSIVWSSSDPTNAPVYATPDARVAIVGNPNGISGTRIITATLGALSDTGTAVLP